MLDVLFGLCFFAILVYFLYAFITRKKRRIARERHKIAREERERAEQLHKMVKSRWCDFKMSTVWKAYRENILAADSNHLGKIISVKGKIRTIERKEYESQFSYSSNPFILLSTSAGGHVGCDMQEGEEKLLMEMRVGDKVKVCGWITSINQDLRAIYLGDCLIQTVEEKEKKDGSE